MKKSKTTERVVAEVPLQLKRQTMAYLKLEGKTFTDFVREAMEQYVAGRQQQSGPIHPPQQADRP